MKGYEKVLIIGKVWPEPKSSAAGLRMMQLISFYQSQGSEVTFASTANKSSFQENLSAIGVQVVSIRLNSDSFNDFILNLMPNTVIFDRFMTEEQFGWRVMESCPDAIRILNSEDLHGLRSARQASIKIDGTLDHVDLLSEKSLRELASIYRCDLSLMVSEVEIGLLKRFYQVSSHKLYFLPLFFDCKQKEIPSYEERNNFMFIGNFLHEPNWDALQFLKKDIWPIIRSILPNAQIDVYGAYPSQKVTDFHSEKEGFFVHGRTGDALKVTMNAKVSLVPIRFGAGIKGKALEAMCVGTPVVITEIGAEDITINGQINGVIKNDPVAFAKAAVEIYNDKKVWGLAQVRGFEIIQSRYNSTNHLPAFKEHLEIISQNLVGHRRKDATSLMVQQQSLLSTKYLSRWIEEKNK